MATTPSAGGESTHQTEPNVRPKKKRSHPGMPDPDAEVIALSPKSLLETNKYVCDICGKGFQRDQNLQLHRRGHNLPWKLKQRPPDQEVKRRVYVCPVASCAHHDPSRALGDLTGIKKHFCRKHGEKKFYCDRCSKSYAVQCDWKAHMKICGTREYPCDCGTIFSRRDSFITHRAFCDALAQESAKSQAAAAPAAVNPKPPSNSSPPPQPPTPSTVVLSPAVSIQSSDLPENQSGHSQQKKETPPISTDTTNSILRARGGSSTSSGNINWNTADGAFALSRGHSEQQKENNPIVPPSLLDLGVGNNSKDLAGVFALSMPAIHSESPASYSSLFCVPRGSPHVERMSLSLSSSNTASLFLSPLDNRQQCTSAPQPAISATALLQKAAQMGSKASSGSFLQGLGLSMSSANDLGDDISTSPRSTGLGLGLESSTSTFHHSMMDPSPAMIFSREPPTLDFLGVGLGANQASSNQYPALFGIASSSFGGGILGGDSWNDPSDEKPGFL